MPGTGREVAHYQNKVFCGIYGRDGDIFLTACQDKKIRIYDTRYLLTSNGNDICLH